jgi:ferredoxin
MVAHGPGAQPTVFAFAAVATGLLYFDLAIFREQLCLVVCPYGRLQGALLDRDSLIIGYDVARGEPRGKVGKTTGDCVDCRRCVAVCPTGIDIRKGLQLDCIACTACIDACDEIMDSVERPRGLIRYDSENGLEKQPRSGLLRGRVLVYAGALVASLLAFGLVIGGRAGLDAQLLRLPGAPYTLVEGAVRNGFELHLAGALTGMALLGVFGIGLGALSYALAVAVRKADWMFWMVQQTFLFPIMILSGMLLPLENGPGWMQALAKGNPLAYVLDAERSLFAGDLTTSFQVLEPGFRYWFDGDDACVGFVDTGPAWVVAGPPIAPADRLAQVAARFAAAAREAGKRTAWFGTEPRFRDATGWPSLVPWPRRPRSSRVAQTSSRRRARKRTSHRRCRACRRRVPARRVA